MVQVISCFHYVGSIAPIFNNNGKHCSNYLLPLLSLRILIKHDNYIIDLKSLENNERRISSFAPTSAQLYQNQKYCRFDVFALINMQNNAIYTVVTVITGK